MADKNRREGALDTLVAAAGRAALVRYRQLEQATLERRRLTTELLSRSPDDVSADEWGELSRLCEHNVRCIERVRKCQKILRTALRALNV